MGLFGRTPSAPSTSYGYVPPAGATVRGWRCPADGCGVGDDSAPRRWPFACTECGGPADPEFDEPWAHDARGLWLRHQMQVASPGMTGFWLRQLHSWMYRDAMVAGDVDGAEEIRLDGHRLDPADVPGDLHFPVVQDALAHDLLDAAHDELLFWSAGAVTDGVEDDNGRRTNCRQLLACMLSFLEHPSAARHPGTAELTAAAARLRDAIHEVLTVDLRRRARSLAAESFAPAGEPPAVPDDTVGQMVLFGRYSFDPMDSAVESGDMWSRVAAPRYPVATADPDAFCRDLARQVIPAGAWAVYGAQRLVVELLGPGYRGAHFLRMQDAALDWLHAEGVPVARLTGYEYARWSETHGPDTWTRAAPPTSPSPVDDLTVLLSSIAAASGPLLDAIGRVEAPGLDGAPDRRGVAGRLLRTSPGPGSPEWGGRSVNERCAWWTARIGTVAAASATLSGLAGPVAERAQLRPVLTAAGRGVAVCAVAREHGVDDHGVLVRMLSSVLFDRDVSFPIGSASSSELVHAVASDLRPTGLLPLGRALLRIGRALAALSGALVEQPRSRKGVVGRIPVVGAGLRDLADERAAVHAAATRASTWITASERIGRP